MRERERLQAVLLAYRGEYSYEQIAEIVGRARSCVIRWINHYREGGLEELLKRRYAKVRAGKVPPECEEQLVVGLKQGRWKRAKEIREWMDKEHKAKLSLPGVYYWLRRVGGKLKVPGKSHRKKDVQKTQSFKEQLYDKLCALGIAKGQKVRLWMQNEHRYGLQAVLRKCWSLRGHQPRCPWQSKYEWGWVYGALEVGGQNGCEFLYLPRADLDSSKLFLEQIAQGDPAAEQVVIWDQAGFHQKESKHDLPERIHVVALPAYSPELNPVEKLWDMVKRRIGNRVWDSLTAIEEAITEELRGFWQNFICNSQYLTHQTVTDLFLSNASHFSFAIGR